MTQPTILFARRRPHRRMGAPMLVLAASAGALTAFSACSDAASRQFLSLGTAGTGGIYYPLGGAMAARLSISDTLRQYTAEVSGGSVENVNRLRERQTDLAFATGNTVFEAFFGGQDYPEPVSDLRILAPLYPNMTHIVVKRGSTATSLADLAGGVVSVGPPGSGTEQMSRQILETYGLTYDDVTPRYLSFNESSTALKDGAIDAAIISVGYPAAAVLEATTTGGARLLAMEADRVETLRERYPYYVHGEIPAGTYPGTAEPVPTAGIMNWVVAMADLPDEVVAAVVRLLTDEREELAQVHEMVHQITMDALADAPIRLHDVTQAWVDANLPGGS
ncbi:MAG: TAXI family TRAP transporter solute-binding subunit [Gemmatimonadetes bacterium]|nr:TAXI family TRAP transporter solute-binding subunit [Gemmatimonadota bacterium]